MQGQPRAAVFGVGLLGTQIAGISAAGARSEATLGARAGGVGALYPARADGPQRALAGASGADAFGADAFGAGASGADAFGAVASAAAAFGVGAGSGAARVPALG